MDRASGARRRSVAGGAAIIAAAAALSGCAQIAPTAHDISEASHLAPMGVNPSSPVAADVERAETLNGPVPPFTSVPPKPTDVRTAQAYRAQVVGVVDDRRALNRWNAANPSPADDTEVFAAAQRTRVAGETAPAPEQGAETDAFAQRLREAAGAPQGTLAKKPAKVRKPAPVPASN